MKKLIYSVICVLVLLSLCACGAERAEAPAAQVTNPVMDSSQAEIEEKEGIKMSVPDDAANVRWSRINGDVILDQVVFEYGGDEYCYRVQVTDGRQDISGMYYEWGEPEGGTVPEDTPMCMTNEKGQGVIIWFDGERSHTVSMDDSATGEKLIQMMTMVAD